MIFAVVPWNEKFCNNEIFNPDSDTNKNGLAEPYADLKAYMNENGHTINTIDMYSDLSQVDFFLFFDWDDQWIFNLIKKGYACKMVYCNAEPPTVRKLNTEQGLKELKKYFQYIMTWNKDFVDNKRVFYRTIPYNFVEHIDTVPYTQKKLLTSISANKKSDYKDELYTERERLITYFENEIPDQFDMYGVGWDKENHKSYKGSPDSKFDTYNNYKFAIAFENTKNVRGYITEKIFDCLTGGIVPIYYGADDILDYVSSECFIDYRKFGSLNLLKEYLLNMSKQEYEKYLDAAKKVVLSDELQFHFSGKMYAQNIINMCETIPTERVNTNVINIIKLGFRIGRQQIKARLIAIKKRVKYAVF